MYLCTECIKEVFKTFKSNHLWMTVGGEGGRRDSLVEDSIGGVSVGKSNILMRGRDRISIVTLDHPPPHQPSLYQHLKLIGRLRLRIFCFVLLFMVM